MRFVVSACLLGCNCKYNGGNNYNPGVERFLAGIEYITVCPEVDGGLPTPRVASEITGGSTVWTKTGRDVTAQFLQGAKHAVNAAADFGAEAAILKERSPSCGVRSIYSGDFSGTTIPGNGMTSAALKRAGILLFTEEAIPGEGLVVDYSAVTEKIVCWLKEKVEGAGARGCIVGLSGGIDSAVVAALAKRAFPDTVLTVILPVESSREDVEDAWFVSKELGLNTVEINLDKVFHTLISSAEAGTDLGPENLAVANVKPRLRMTTLYYLGARHNYLVIGTGNKSELVTGFYTKYGDGGVDLEPIGELVKAQVVGLARHLGLPDRIIERTPSAGLWPGQTDEDEFGFSYRQLDEYILSGTTDTDVVDRIEDVIRSARHKQEMPPTCPL